MLCKAVARPIGQSNPHPNTVYPVLDEVPLLSTRRVHNYAEPNVTGSATAPVPAQPCHRTFPKTNRYEETE